MIDGYIVEELLGLQEGREIGNESREYTRIRDLMIVDRDEREGKVEDLRRRREEEKIQTQKDRRERRHKEHLRTEEKST